jgi:hypothetical protein
MEDKLLQNENTMKRSDNINEILLKRLVENVEEYFGNNQKDIRNLSHCLKKVFSSQLKIHDKNVSNNYSGLHHIDNKAD